MKLDSKKKINNKLLIGSGIILSLAFAMQFYSNLEIEDKENISVNNVEQPQLVEVADYNEVERSDLDKIQEDNYYHNQDDILLAKDSGVYKTYNDVSKENPFRQQYSYALESQEETDLSKYKNSYYGAIANSDDYNSKFPEN